MRIKIIKHIFILGIYKNKYTGVRTFCFGFYKLLPTYRHWCANFEKGIDYKGFIFEYNFTN